MPALIQAVPGTNTIYATFQATLPRWTNDDSELWDTRYVLNRRGPQTDYNHLYTWQDGRWPSRTSFANDPASGMLCPGRDAGSNWSGGYQPWMTGFGTSSLKFIMGRCVDSVGSGVSGAIVQGFVTANDVLERETTADSNGYYELGTQYAGTNHYLVAYRPGSPDIFGTTVNTLQGTNRDGT